VCANAFVSPEFPSSIASAAGPARRVARIFDLVLDEGLEPRGSST